LAHAVVKRIPTAVLAAILCLAALLRLTGLDHGVRRGSPAGDEEHNFVEPVRAMWSTPTADPGVRPGYPGFFNDLALVPIGLGDRIDGDRGAYAAGRGLVAVFGVLSVFLVFRLVRDLAGTWPGLFSAALMALSRGEVVHAHFITPDLVVISALLGVLLIVRRRPLGPRAAVAAGIVCGLTIAIKYTGVVAVPALAAALVRDRLPPRRVLGALAAAIVSFALAAPFAFLQASPEGAGVAAAIRDYYSPTGYAGATARTPEYAGASAAELAAGYVRQNLSAAGLLLAAAGLVLFRPLASLAPAAAALLAGLALIVPAQIAYPRHVLVPSALLIVLAGCGLRAVYDVLGGAGRRLRWAVMLALAALALAPARGAIAVSARFRRPDALEQAATWIEKNVPGQPLVAAAYPRLILDDRFEVRHWAAPAEIPLADLPPGVARHYDVVVGPSAELEALAGPELRWRMRRAFDDGEAAVAAAFPDRPEGTPVVPSKVDASEAAPDAARAWAGSSPWRSASATGWTSGEWDRPRRIVRVEVVSDAAGGLTPQGVVLEGRSRLDGGWRRIRAWSLRPRTLGSQSPRMPHGQTFVLDPPEELLGLRVVGRGNAAWGLGRITVLADPSGGG
jgi:hypothetical protein